MFDCNLYWVGGIELEVMKIFVNKSLVYFCVDF